FSGAGSTPTILVAIPNSGSRLFRRWYASLASGILARVAIPNSGSRLFRQSCINMQALGGYGCNPKLGLQALPTLTWQMPHNSSPVLQSQTRAPGSSDVLYSE